MKIFILLLSVFITACEYQGMSQEEQSNRKFQNCLYYASPASSEAIKACKEAAWSDK